MTHEHRAWLQYLTRRDFLKGSAVIAASFAATSPALAAVKTAAASATESSLLLPPLLTRPTGTSIRITALNHERPAEAVVELRKEGVPDWKRPLSPLKAAGYTMFDWNLQDLVPATRYKYRVLLKKPSEESFRQTATGSFTTQ